MRFLKTVVAVLFLTMIFLGAAWSAEDEAPMPDRPVMNVEEPAGAPTVVPAEPVMAHPQAGADGEPAPVEPPPGEPEPGVAPVVEPMPVAPPAETPTETPAGETSQGTGRGGTEAAPPYDFSPSGSSSGTTTTQTQTPAQTRPQDLINPSRRESRVSMNFEKADITGVLKFLSNVSGVTIVSGPEVTGAVTIISLKQITVSEAFEVVNTALRVRGFTMVGNRDDKIVRVVAVRGSAMQGMRVVYGKDPNIVNPGDGMVTMVMPLEYLDATKVVTELRPLVNEGASGMVTVSSSNTLVVSDDAANVRRIALIIKELDKKETFDTLEVRVYRCLHASATTLADVVTRIFQTTQATGQTQRQPFSNNPMVQAFMRGPGGTQQNQQQAGQTNLSSTLLGSRGEVRVVADTRTNALIITAARDKMSQILAVVKDLDIDTDPEVKVKSFTLKNADATTVAAQLGLLLQAPQSSTTRQQGQPATTAGVNTGLKPNTVVADMRTNSLLVTSSEQDMRLIEDMIAQLDSPRVLSESTRIFKLRFAKAADLATTLNNLFKGVVTTGTTTRSGTNTGNTGYRQYVAPIGSTGTTGAASGSSSGPLAQLKEVNVVAETKTNSLLITGPPNSFSAIEDIIQQLDKRTPQVFVEVAIVDVALDDNNKFGVEWNWADMLQGNNSGNTSFGLADETSGMKYSILNGDFKAMLHAMATRYDVKVLSTPTITTADNVEATISIGQDEPFVSAETETSTGIRRTVSFRNVAVALTVTPYVNEISGVVAMDVHQTINEIISRETELGAPIIANREAQTRVTVKNGQTIVIGGIIKNNHDYTTQGVPVLSQIPLIGELFKHRSQQDRKSELMVFLTPHILSTDEEVDHLTDEMRGRLMVQPNIGIVDMAPKP